MKDFGLLMFVGLLAIVLMTLFMVVVIITERM